MTVQETWDHYRKMPEQDMYDYAPFLREVARGEMLEIGVCAGVSTAAFLMGLDDKDEGHLYSIDIDPACGRVFEHPRWTFWCCDSRMLALSGDFDLAFIDGDHSYDAVLSDLRNVERFVKPGGLILAHDVQPSEVWLPKILQDNWYPVEECRQAWKDFCALHPTWPAEIRPGITGLGVIRKGAAN